MHKFLAKFYPSGKTTQMRIEIKILLIWIMRVCMKHGRGTKNS